jgi:5-methylcytosine-specific restriction endonuclease McrA
MPHADPEKKRAYLQAWRRRNAEKVRAYSAAWVARDPDHAKSLAQQRDRRHRERDPERAREKVRRSRARHIDRRREYDRAYRAANPDLRRSHERRRRARKMAAVGHFTQSEWKSLLGRYGHVCLRCGSPDRLEADHVVPLALGGSDSIDNIQPLCRPCNARKWTHIVDYRVPTCS